MADKRSDYRKALVEVMAEAARGATMLNVWAPSSTPAVARGALTAVGAAGFGGVAAMDSIYRGARGKNVVEPREFEGIERVAGESIKAGTTASVIAAGITKRVDRSARIGGRVAMATMAGAAAAEVIRQLDDIIATGDVADAAVVKLEDARTMTAEKINTAKTKVREAIEGATAVLTGSVKTWTGYDLSPATDRPATPELPSASPRTVTIVDEKEIMRRALEQKNDARVRGDADGKRAAEEEIRAIKMKRFERLLERAVPKSKARRMYEDLYGRLDRASADRTAAAPDLVIDGHWRTRRSPKGKSVREFVRPRPNLRASLRRRSV